MPPVKDSAKGGSGSTFTAQEPKGPRSALEELDEIFGATLAVDGPSGKEAAALEQSARKLRDADDHHRQVEASLGEPPSFENGLNESHVAWVREVHKMVLEDLGRLWGNPNLVYKSEKAHPEVSPPAESLKSFIYGGLATYSRTRYQGYLLAVKTCVEDALGTVDPGEALDSTTKENLAIVRNLIEGRETFYIEEAQEAARACKDLWPKPADGSTETIRPQAIMSLTEGLREDAMKETIIREAHYRVFITLFCEDFARRQPNDVESRDEAIRKAHRLALRIVGAPIPAAQPVPDICDAPAWCLVTLEEVYRNRAKTVESFREWLRAEMKEYPGGSCDTAEDLV
ncbi:hypothetical protein ACJZ2D_016026 [Fusarium nematophilum]